VTGNPYALRANEVSGLASNKKVVALPSRMPELLGIVGIRGQIVPVYSLAALLGYAPEDRDRWLALCGQEERIGLAFSDFEGYLRVPLEKVYVAQQEGLTRWHVKHAVGTADLVRSVVSIASLVGTIKRRCAEISSSQER
jgi:purine-binding chemotaxis protein CheW